MSESPNQNLRVMLNKVPEVTLAFWVIKIMSTTVGETGADYLAVHVGLGTAVTGGIMVGLLATVLLLQLRMRRYVPWIYWLTVVLASIVGTQITDTLTDRLEISLCVSMAAFAAALARGPASARRDIHNGFSKLVRVPRALGTSHRVASTALAINLIRSSRAALIPSMREPFTTPAVIGAQFPIDKVHCHSSMTP